MEKIDGCLAGTLVFTEKGQFPIESVEVGMRVLTHTGEWHEVMAVGKGETSTVIWKGHHFGLECAPNQKIYTAVDKRIDGKRVISETGWTDAENVADKRYAVPHNIGSLEYEGFAIEKPDWFYYFVGRFLADGWLEKERRQIVLCAGDKKIEKTEKALGELGIEWHVREMANGTFRYEFANHELGEWLEGNFGKYSYGKYLPSWVYGLSRELRYSLFRGLMDCDGYTHEGGMATEITSKKLAIGLRLLGETLGYRTAIHTRQRNQVICCHKVCKPRQSYVVTFFDTSVGGEVKDGKHDWYKAKSPETRTEMRTVYSLTVAKDDSYVADGVVVGRNYVGKQ